MQICRIVSNICFGGGGWGRVIFEGKPLNWKEIIVKMPGLYLDMSIISHKFCGMLSILNELTLLKKF